MKFLSLCIMLLLVQGCATGVSLPAKPTSDKSTITQQLRVHWERAEQFYKTNSLDDAEAEYRAMLDIKAEEENALYRLGNIAFKKREFDQAASYFDRAIRSNPKNRKAHYNLASIRLMQAENHFKYYTALADADADEDLSKIAKLTADIDDFNSRVEVSSQAGGSLDKLAGVLKRE